jgi:hypothetical protein
VRFIRVLTSKLRWKNTPVKPVDRVIVYEAKHVDALDMATITAITSGRPLIILVHSGRAGRSF